MTTVTYSFHKKIDGMAVYKKLLEDKYIIEFWEDGKLASIHFYFDFDGSLIVDNVYKNTRNYRTYRHIKKYAENKALIASMMKLR